MGKPQRGIDPFRDELVALRRALGNRIRELCKAKGWSQEQLSAYAHVHRTFAAALERGEKIPLLSRHRVDCTLLWHHDGGIDDGY